MKKLRVTHNLETVKFEIVSNDQVKLLKEVSKRPDVDYAVVAGQYANKHKVQDIEVILNDDLHDS